MFTGEWIEKEFGFSGESFSLAYHEWDKKNIEYLNKLGITDIKRPKINLTCILSYSNVLTNLQYTCFSQTI